MAFHYAYLYYSDPEEQRRPAVCDFPDTPEPGAADFLYYSFVVGMTAQVSDVQVTSTRIRKTMLGHSIVSFFFNTVLIAMAVNAVVALTRLTRPLDLALDLTLDLTPGLPGPACDSLRLGRRPGG